MYEDFRIKVFKAVADCHSFTLASRQLGISQPAVSQNIAELEKLSGFKFFTRSKSNIMLTEAGSVFNQLVDKVLMAYENLNNVFKDYASFQEYLVKFNELKQDPRFEAIKELYL